MAGHIRLPRRPPGWQAPGSIPVGAASGASPDDDEDACFLSGDWRLFQKLRGHRWSLDDLVTAHFAVEEVSARPPPAAVALFLFRLDARGGRLFVSSAFAPGVPTVLTDFVSTQSELAYEVVAMDQAGNDSAAAQVTVRGFGCQAIGGTAPPLAFLVVMLAGLQRRRRPAAAPPATGVR